MDKYQVHKNKCFKIIKIYIYIGYLLLLFFFLVFFVLDSFKLQKKIKIIYNYKYKYN